MARSNPIGKIKDTAIGTIKGSVSTTQDVVGQAVDKARGTVETVTAMVPGRKSAPKKSGSSAKSRALRDAPAVEADTSRKVQGDPLAPAATKATKKASAKKAPAKKAPAKAAAKKAPAKAAAKKAPAKKSAAKKGVTTATPADVAKKSAKKAPAKKAASKKASPAKRTASKTPAAKKTSPAVQAETVYSTSSDNAEPKPTQGLSSDAPLIDPGTAKATLTEAQTLARAADPDKG